MVSLLPNKGNFGTKDEVLQQAEQIWSMLDEMVDSDPTAYKNFIENQMKDAHKFIEEKGTMLEFGLNVKLRDEEGYLFVEIYSSVLVPSPNLNGSIANLPLFIQPEQSSWCSNKHQKPHIFVVLNPILTRKMLTTGSLSSEQHLLIEYLLANVQTQVPFPLITTNFIFTDKNECRGNPKKLQESLNKEFCERKQNKVLNRNGDEHKNNMDAIKLPNQMTMPNNSPTLNISQELSSKERKSNLIEELQVKEPSYNLDWSNADSLCITIQLPGVKSGDECEVDIIQDVLMVKAAGKYDLFLPLDIHIDESNAEAQFFKEKSVLSIKVPYHKAA